MKLLFFAALFVSAYCDVFFGYYYSTPYTDRYNIRYASFDALFSPIPAASLGIQNITDANFYDIPQCKNISHYARTPSLEQLVNFHHELVDICPKLYETIRGENFTTWGPVDEFLQIWYMKFVDALWLKIQERTCRCQLYDDFVNGASAGGDTVLSDFLEANYDPALCEINDQTMYKWNLFLNKPEIKNRTVKFIRVGEFSIPIIHQIAKAYLTDARYQMYFEGPPYPLADYFGIAWKLVKMDNGAKFFFKRSGEIYNQHFPSLNLAGRQRYFLMFYPSLIDNSFTFWPKFNRIPLDPVDEVTHYHLVLYFCRKDYLKAKRSQYSSVPVPTSCFTTPTPCTTTTLKTEKISCFV